MHYCLKVVKAPAMRAATYAVRCSWVWCSWVQCNGALLLEGGEGAGHARSHLCGAVQLGVVQLGAVQRCTTA